MEGVDFIKSLDLAPRTHAVANPDVAGQVGGASSVSFVGNIPLQNQSDVMNSTLLAQLAATKQYNPQTQVQQWYDFYNGVLAKIAWVTQGMQINTVDIQGTNVSVSDVILKFAIAVLSESAYAAFKVVIDALANPSNEGTYQLFNHYAANSNQAAFQLGTVEMSGGNPVFTMFANQYSVSKQIDDVLFIKISKGSVTFLAGNNTMTLNTPQYANYFREAVQEKLGQSGKDMIKNIDI